MPVDVPPECTVSSGTEEAFGPVLLVEAVKNAEEAPSRSQTAPYGLSAPIMTGDQQRGLELAGDVANVVGKAS